MQYETGLDWSTTENRNSIDYLILIASKQMKATSMQVKKEPSGPVVHIPGLTIIDDAFQGQRYWCHSQGGVVQQKRHPI
jgi:hypothetical protein